MGNAKSGDGSRDAEVAEVDHWIYGVVPGIGYTTKAFSHGLDAGLYDPYLRGHYTPIRASIAQTTETLVDLHMMHPIQAGQEVLLSRISRGVPDEAGRPTFTNHTVVVPTNALRSSRITLDAVYRAIEGFERESADVMGEVGSLRIPLRSEEEGALNFGSGIHKHLTFPALETLATRMMAEPGGRTLLLCRNTTADARNKTLHLIVELLGLACGLPLLTAISDAPRASALNFFNLVVAPRGVRADSTWVLLESALSENVLPRVSGRDDVYQMLTATFRQSKDLRFAR